MAERSTLPSMFPNCRPRMEDCAGIGQRGQIGVVHRMHWFVSAVLCYDGGETLTVGWFRNLRPEGFGFAMRQKAPEETFARCIAPHQFGASGRVGFGMEIECCSHSNSA